MTSERDAFYTFVRQALTDEGYSVFDYDGAFHFSWAVEGLVEQGGPCSTPPRAWALALAHRLASSHPMHTRFLQAVASQGPEQQPIDPVMFDPSSDAEEDALSPEEFEAQMTAWELAHDAKEVLADFKSEPSIEWSQA